MAPHTPRRSDAPAEARRWGRTPSRCRRATPCASTGTRSCQRASCASSRSSSTPTRRPSSATRSPRRRTTSDRRGTRTSSGWARAAWSPPTATACGLVRSCSG